MKEPDFHIQTYGATITAHTLIELYKHLNGKEEITDALIEQYAIPVLQSYDEIHPKDYPWMVDDAKWRAHCFLEQTEWDSYADLIKGPEGEHFDMAASITTRMKHIC